jgi:type I restriction-modification system DNA methylase subunit
VGGRVSASILDNVLVDLDYVNGELFDTSFSPNRENKSQWLEKGDWLKSAAQADVYKVFFVGNNPAVVFAQCGKSSYEKIEAFNKIWCLSGPRILFLEAEGELSVIDLAQEPVRITKTKKQREYDTLIKLNSVKDILENLQQFHRDNIESGKVFQDVQFGDIKNRADHTLISDLRFVRRKLMDSGLSESCTHSLIGRSIFIRYLEDRKILTDEYFIKVAGKNKEWKELIIELVPDKIFDFSNNESMYLRILQDKDFTYTLFRSLSHDFNGDMFPDIDTEENEVKPKHLELLRNMLQGNTEPHLFFFSYKFNIIPLNLISAIYEEFYQSSLSPNTGKKNQARQEGAFYTPPALVEFVLSRVLTKDVIKQKPRILDPACGSGIFLVEAFRRIVRYYYSEGKTISFTKLKEILKDQLVGIEINKEAAHITAFSLYLALLNYLDPPSILEQIRKGERLPNLVTSGKKSNNHFNVIHECNAFNLEKETIGKIDIVVGNPPWGSPGKKEKLSVSVRKQIEDMLAWCSKKSYEIGDEDPSQAFLLLALDVLTENGHCAMLTSNGVLLGLGKKTVVFRKTLINNACLTEVFNFAHIRKFFFNKAISPFFFIHYRKQKQNDTPVVYWSPKQIKCIENTQYILLSKYDRALIIKQNLISNKTWKMNWFGRHADYVFISQLNNYKKLITIVNRNKSGRGYQKTPAEHEYPDVSTLASLKLSSFKKYSELSFIETPKKLHRAGVKSVYHGSRLLIKKGISTRANGSFVARYETQSFCFTNTIDGLKLMDDNENKYLLILGILWSSFSKYYFFNISAKWGIWHDEIYLNKELLYLPIPEELTNKNATHIVSLVRKLREYKPEIQDLIYPKGVPKEKIDRQRKIWENELDKAVFDLYELTEQQKELINDFINVTLPFFYNPHKSIGVKPVIVNNDTEWIENYAIRFSECWQPYLNSDETLRADLCLALSGNVIALEFYIADFGDNWDLVPKNKLWDKLLSDIAKFSTRPLGTSEILVDGIVYSITNDTIIIIKRNEKRLWTKSLAYEDAESIMTKRILSSNIKTVSLK